MKRRIFVSTLLLAAWFVACPLLAQEVVLSTPLRYRGFDPGQPLLTVQGSGNQTGNIIEFRDRATAAPVTWMDFDGKLNTVRANISAQWLNKVCMVDENTPGADAGAKIAYCRDRLPATGGTVDARGLEGAQSIPTPLVISKPVKLLLGSATYTLPTGAVAIAATGFDVESDNVQIIGNGATVLQATRDWANGTFYGIGVFGFTGFVAEGLDIRITTTGAMPGATQAINGICVRGARTTYDPPSTNFSITNNRIWVRGAVTDTAVAKEAAIWIFGGSAALRAKGGLISGNVLDDSHGRGIYLYNAENVSIVGNPIRNLGATIPALGAATGIRVIGGYNVTVSSNPITMAGVTGTIHGVRIEGDSANYGITLSGNSAVNQVANDTLVTGMYVDNASRVTISGNTLLNTAANTGTSFGLRFLTTAGAVSKVEVPGNTIAGWTQSQIRFSDAGPTDIHIAGNFLGLTNAGGAPLIDGLTEAQLAANRITTVGNVLEQQTVMTDRVPANYTLSSRRDAAQNVIFDTGAAASQSQFLIWKDLGVSQWQLQRIATTQNFELSDAVNGAVRLVFVPAGLSRINSAGTAAVLFNLTNPSGTGGVAFGDGAANIVASVSSTGLGTFNGGVKVAAAGTTITKHLSATASLNFTALAANTCETLTIALAGAADGDTVMLGVPNALADVDGATERTTFFGWVSAADVVSVRRCNPTLAATADPAAATVRADVWQH